jgi:hypothetical protein
MSNSLEMIAPLLDDEMDELESFLFSRIESDELYGAGG